MKKSETLPLVVHACRQQNIDWMMEKNRQNPSSGLSGALGVSPQTPRAGDCHVSHAQSPRQWGCPSWCANASVPHELMSWCESLGLCTCIKTQTGFRQLLSSAIDENLPPWDYTNVEMDQTVDCPQAAAQLTLEWRHRAVRRGTALRSM